MSKFEHLDALLSSFVQSGQSGPAGCACMVMQDGNLLYEGYHGYADLEKQTPITPDTVYRLYSMTKVIVCTAALMLYERGKFLLHEPISEYIPEFQHARVFHLDKNGEYVARPASRPVRIQDALTMSIGLPNPEKHETPTGIAVNRVFDSLMKQHQGKFDLQTAIRTLITEVPMAFEPGDHWMYGLGHDIVAALIEVISGKSIGQFLQEEIFDPLEMNSTGYRYRDDIAQRMATCYQIGPEGRVPVPGPFDMFHAPDANYEGGGFGLYSTVGDYMKFTQMLANGGKYRGVRLIGRKTIDLMRTNYLDETKLGEFRSTPYYHGYGYGLGVRTLIDPAGANSNSSLGEFGWSGLAGTWTSIDPSEKLSIVYMHQTFPHMQIYHHLRVRAAVYGAL